MKTQLKQDGSYSKYSKKRQRLLDSEDEDNDLLDSVIVRLGPGSKNKKNDEWNRAKRDLNDLMYKLSNNINTMLLGIGVPSRHSSYIFGRP